MAVDATSSGSRLAEAEALPAGGLWGEEPGAAAGGGWAARAARSSREMPPLLRMVSCRVWLAHKGVNYGGARAKASIATDAKLRAHHSMHQSLERNFASLGKKHSAPV